MLTTDEIEAMQPEDRLALVMTGAAAHFGPRFTDTQLARAVGGYERTTVQRWKRQPTAIPFAVCMVASHWAGMEAKEPEAVAIEPALDPEVVALVGALRMSAPLAQLAVNGLSDVIAALARLVPPDASDAAPDAPVSEPDTEA